MEAPPLAPVRPDTDALPFLVVHGAWFSLVIVAALALVLVETIALVRYITARRTGRMYTPWPRMIRGVVFLTAMMTSFVTLRLVGEYLVERASERDYALADGHALLIGQLDAISVAAALPSSRDDALRTLATALERHPYRDDKSVRRQLGLDEIMFGSCGNLSHLDARPEEQLAVARRCHFDRAAFDILVKLGRFDEAWASQPSDLDWPAQSGMVAIALGKWDEAAIRADKMADAYVEEAAGRTEYKQYRIADALRYRCLAQWFRTLSGEPAGAEKLRALATAPGNPAVICAPIVAQTLPTEERIAFLHAALTDPLSQADHVLSARLATQLSLFLEGDVIDRVTLFTTLDIVAPVGNAELAVRPWLAALAVEAWRNKSDPQSLALALGGVVLQHVHRGDFAAARRTAEEARSVLSQLPSEYRVPDVDSWFTVIALREGSRELPPSGHVDAFMDALRLRRGDEPLHGMSRYPRGCEERLRSALSDAQHGDGRPLALGMQSCSVSATFGIRDLIGVLPFVQEGRTELASALRWWTDSFDLDGFEPFSSVAFAAGRRDIARYVGDEQNARWWGDIAMRLEAPLEDRTRALALAVWSE